VVQHLLLSLSETDCWKLVEGVPSKLVGLACSHLVRLIDQAHRILPHLTRGAYFKLLFLIFDEGKLLRVKLITHDGHRLFMGKQVVFRWVYLVVDGVPTERDMG